MKRSSCAFLRAGLAASILALAPLGAVKAQTATAAAISNGKLTATVDNTGYFGMTQTSVTPNAVILRSATKTSYLTIRIDGGTPGALNGTATQSGFDVQWGNTNYGTWITQPTADPSSPILKASFQTGGATTEATPRTIPSILVDVKVRLVQDMAQYVFTITNRDTRAHTVGIRMVQDYSVAGSGPDAPVYTPALPPLKYESDLSSMMPASWKAGTTSATGGNTVGGVLAPPHSTTGALVDDVPVRFADRIVFAPPTKFTATTWEVINAGNAGGTGVDPSSSLLSGTGDAAAAVYFSPQMFGVGQSDALVTYFGLAQSTTDYDYPFAAGLDGATSFIILDASAVATEKNPNPTLVQRLSPQPLTVTGFLHNFTETAMTNITARLQLPAGLAFDTDETATKTASSLGTENETSFNWKIVPNGAASGRLYYSMIISSGPGPLGKSITRYIDVPALPTQSFNALPQMLTVPYNLEDPTPSAALGISQFDFDILQWNPTTGQYETVQLLRPGQGYWYLPHDTQRTITLPTTATPVTATGGVFQIALKQGWNQIGNPFLYAVNWGEVQVLDTNLADTDAYKPVTVQVASDTTHNWILPTIFSYDQSTGSYSWNEDFSTSLVPFTGYWVKAVRPNITLLINTPTSRAVRAVSRAADGGKIAGGWSLQLTATGGNSTDARNYIGVSSNGKDGVDTLDVQKPPATVNGISLGILHSDWDSRSGSYARDVRSASATAKTWNIVVTSPKPSTDVTVRWTGIAAVPRSWQLFVTDPATGIRHQMRQASSLTVNTGQTGSRALTITAEPATAAGMFRFTAWNVAPSGSRGTGAAVTATATSDADIHVRILRANGGAVRDLGSRATTTRSASVLWNYRDDRGQAVPIGQYMVEIVGKTADGQSARVVIPHIVTR